MAVYNINALITSYRRELKRSADDGSSQTSVLFLFLHMVSLSNSSLKVLLFILRKLLYLSDADIPNFQQSLIRELVSLFMQFFHPYFYFVFLGCMFSQSKDNSDAGCVLATDMYSLLDRALRRESEALQLSRPPFYCHRPW